MKTISSIIHTLQDTDRLLCQLLLSGWAFRIRDYVYCEGCFFFHQRLCVKTVWVENGELCRYDTCVCVRDRHVRLAEEKRDMATIKREGAENNRSRKITAAESEFWDKSSASVWLNSWTKSNYTSQSRSAAPLHLFGTSDHCLATRRSCCCVQSRPLALVYYWDRWDVAAASNWFKRSNWICVDCDGLPRALQRRTLQ